MVQLRTKTKKLGSSFGRKKYFFCSEFRSDLFRFGSEKRVLIFWFDDSEESEELGLRWKMNEFNKRVFWVIDAFYRIFIFLTWSFIVR